jgi:triosephosphate isomerase
MRAVVANWKMNHLRADAEAFATAFLASYAPRDGVMVGVAPPYPLLSLLASRFLDRGVDVLAQNAFHAPRGAFTGEISMAQARDAGCAGVILGHSERRQFFGETDEALAKKVTAAREHGLLPLLCIGESLAQRESGQTLGVLRQQLFILSRTGPGALTVAYEPVWAIGTGRVAEPAQVEEAHAFIREELVSNLGEAGREAPILYGGSVTPENFGDLLRLPEVAGGLVGGASLDPLKFLALVRIAQDNAAH